VKERFTPQGYAEYKTRKKKREQGEFSPPEYEVSIVRKNGEVRHLRAFRKEILWNGVKQAQIIYQDITKRKQAEEALTNSEAKLRKEQKFSQLLLDNSPALIVAIGLDGKTLMMNKALLDTLEYTTEEIKGADYLTTFVPEEDRGMLAGVFQKIMQKRITTLNENRIISKSGRTYLVEWHGATVSHEVVETGFFVGVGIDITERKRAEEAMRKSEERYRTMFESTGTSMILVEEDMTISMANGEFVRNTGYSPDEIIGRMKWTDLVHPDDLGRMVEQHRLRRESQGGALPSYEFRYRTKSGDLRDTLLTIDVLPGTRKSIASLIDITDRKHAEEELLRSEEKYRSLVENSQEGIFQSTAEGHHITVNQAFANILGYESPEEVLATIADIPHQVYVHPEDRTKILQIIEKEGSVKGYEAEFYKKDGSKTWVSINMRAIRDEEGHLLYYQGIDQDIMEKKNMETERQQNIARLRKSLQATINAMASTVETRDPYTAGHQLRVADLARSIAAEMHLNKDQIDSIRMASSIHDIGKIALPAEILSKPTKLTDLEFGLIKTHSQSGYDILKDIEFPWPVADVVLQHHERMDGSGYPHGLKGENISLEARILAVADVVEAITSHRPYRAALGIDVALEEISRNRGILYDADVVDACLKLFREKGYTLVIKK
jgi:PAS domain S-box-containing protein